MQKDRKEKLAMPRSSSPVAAYVELPCIVEQTFATIPWDDFDDSESGEKHDTSLRTRDSEGNALDYAQNFSVDSPLESRLSPTELVPFHGCVIPPLTPQPDFFSEDSDLTDEATFLQPRTTQSGGKCIMTLHKHFENKQGEVKGYKERNCHLKQLASRAKYLAAVLEKLTTVSESNFSEAIMPYEDHPTLSPCKRQRLDEGYETEPDSVEYILRDVSTRCNEVLHRTAATCTKQREAVSICTYGSFSGLQTSFSNKSSEKTAYWKRKKETLHSELLSQNTAQLKHMSLLMDTHLQQELS
ncbi:hypothetical protein WMY93_005284 [Mugilogobius chulae]|uniref:Multicilin n=1 Tax=Mugilogobius chulae TaxID=88201 RepID=A0AAW0PTG9_9GOBI